MTSLSSFWRYLRGTAVAEQDVVLPEQAEFQQATYDLDIAPNDPLLAYCLNSKGVIDISELRLESPALEKMREAGVKLIVPLVSQGDLIGLINLGQRLSEQEYTSDDYKLLQDLSSQAAPALKVAQLVEQQKQAAAERERIQQELRVARLIQQTLLPQELPQLSNWYVDAYYQPARAVGGDFYDFIYYEDGRVAFIVADVTDKGVPAALVMATTRSILRAAAERLAAPGAILERTNNVLVAEIPPKMFVTCFIAVLDPVSGRMQYANAGHDVPYHIGNGSVGELRARGMPLGLMPGMTYEEKETVLSPSDIVLLYSDGLVEAHAPDREMFGFPRLQGLLGDRQDGRGLTEFLLAQLAAFTGQGWEQEDDVTLVTIQRMGEKASADLMPDAVKQQSFAVASAPGNEKEAMARVKTLAAGWLPEARLEKLGTAVAEATMNAMEHGNQYDTNKMVAIAMTISPERLRVTISDSGQGTFGSPGEEPDLAAKLAGEQSPRGWGLFLIKNMVDEMNVLQDAERHTIELVMHLQPDHEEGDSA